MSFEGRFQKVCICGHYEEQDVYAETDNCTECGYKWSKSNLVDDTNEGGEGYDERLKPKKPSLKNSFSLFLADWKARDSQ